MSNAVLKEQKMFIPARDKSIVARPRPAFSPSYNHEHQAKKAFEISFKNHKKAYDLLAKF